MARSNRDFLARPTGERVWILENSWCDSCNEADLGMENPVEFEQDGKIFVEGNCSQCGASIQSALEEKIVPE
jgi:hypothetical protein